MSASSAEGFILFSFRGFQNAASSSRVSLTGLRVVSGDAICVFDTQSSEKAL